MTCSAEGVLPFGVGFGALLILMTVSGWILSKYNGCTYYIICLSYTSTIIIVDHNRTVVI